jgi:predicted nucleotidyltransferase
VSFESLKVPGDMQARLRSLCSTLSATLGDDLASVIVFGSAVRGGWIAGKSDVDLVVVLKRAGVEQLRAIANPLVAARAGLRIEAMLLVEAEVARAADVFPLFYEDIQRCSVVLHGVSPFVGLSIDPQHRRLRIEQELREHQIRTRRAVVDALGDTTQLAGLCHRKLRQLRGPLHALLSHAGRSYGLDLAALDRITADPPAAMAALDALLGAAITDVDQRGA